MTARLTPYELLATPLEVGAFPAIRVEADARGTDPRRRDQFLLLGHAGAALAEWVPDDAPSDAIDEYGELLYQCFQFWSFGRRLYVVSEPVAAELARERYDMSGWVLAAPPACYFQLPYQRFWGRVAPTTPFEPIDGFFVVVAETETRSDAGAHLRIQMILGLRPERPGLSLVSYRTDLDPRQAVRAGSPPWRDDAQPFANTLPAGERKGYLSIATTSELETYVVRALNWIDTRTASLRTEPGSTAEAESTLAHVVLDPVQRT